MYEPRYQLDFNQQTVTEQVKALFFRSLRERVEEEHDPQRFGFYVERFYESRFREIYAVRSEQIAEDVMLRWERFGTEALPDIDRHLERAFEGLLDYFTIQYCPDLNGVLLPSAILKHEHAEPGKTDLWHMIRDFLDFDMEEEVVYFDFLAMPEATLANACKHFLTAERRETVFFICDLSFKSNGKEGFAMTDKAIYWRAPFDKARRVLFREIHTVERTKEWLTVNGHFFTANPSLNLKLYKLLKKLRGWEEPAVYA
ncbi:MAG: hypothetical protein ACKVU2_07450 [Saprospiraceae bacterium]